MDELIGLINVCKLPGMSSHEVVARVRRLAGIKRVGHTGTLDPSACGVLPVCVGRATRLAEYVAHGPKAYRAEITFGVATDSCDAEGEIASQADASGVTDADIAALLPRFTGDIRQTPPAHSAIQIGGVRAYDLIRRQGEVVMPERAVTIYAFEIVRFIPGRRARLLADITCSRGTYIRALARDLGAALGVGGVLTFLARLQVGDCRLEDAVTLDEVAAAAEVGDFSSMLRRADSAITYIPALTIPPDQEAYSHGTTIPWVDEPGLFRVYLGERFLGLGQVRDGMLKPVVNLQI